MWVLLLRLWDFYLRIRICTWISRDAWPFLVFLCFSPLFLSVMGVIINIITEGLGFVVGFWLLLTYTDDARQLKRKEKKWKMVFNYLMGLTYGTFRFYKLLIRYTAYTIFHNVTGPLILGLWPCFRFWFFLLCSMFGLARSILLCCLFSLGCVWQEKINKRRKK